MSLFKSSLIVVSTASLICLAGDGVLAQTRTPHHRPNTTQGGSGGMGTSPTQSSIQSAQNQARSLAVRQHQIWLKNRLAKNAAAKAAAANGTDKSTATTKSSAATDKTTASAPVKTSTGK